MAFSDEPTAALGTLAGRYELVSVLGAGGFGEVYRARDRLLNRTVAIKMLHTARSLSAESRERFLREARATARLQHENIVTLHDVGDDGGRLFLVLEFVEGTPLSEMLRSGPLDSRTAAGVIRDVARALEAAHATGIVHRDIKPANVLVRPDGRVKVADFGVARLTDESDITSEGAVVGTLRYMSPEQLEGQRVTAQSDLFSLGSVAFEAVSGLLPFEGETESDLLANTLRGKRRKFPETLRGEPALAAIIDQLLEKDPASRGSAADVVRQLDPLAVTAYRPSVPQPRSWRRYGVFAAGVVVLIVAIALWMRTAARNAGVPIVTRRVAVQHADIASRIGEHTGTVRKTKAPVLSSPPATTSGETTPITLAGLSFSIAPAPAGTVSVSAPADQIDGAMQAVRLFDQLAGYRFHEEPNAFSTGAASTREIAIDGKGLEPHRLVEILAAAAGWPVIMDPSAAESVEKKLAASGTPFELNLNAPWDAMATSVLRRYELDAFRLERVWLVGSRKRVADWNASRRLSTVSKAVRTDLDSAARAVSAASSERGSVLINRRLRALIISDYPEVIERQMDIVQQIEGRQETASPVSKPNRNFSGARIDIHLRNHPIRGFISMISRLTGLSTVVDPDVKGTVSVDLRDVAWDEALEGILKSTGNHWTFHRDILEVIPETKDVEGEIVVETVKLRREDPAFFEGWRKGLSPKGSLVADRNARLLVIRDVARNAVPFRNLAQRLDNEVSNASRARIIREIRRNGVDAAFDLQKRLGESDPDYVYDEPQWNAVGYFFLERQDTTKAIAIFKRVVAEHPQSWNAYDSLAEAYMKAGDKTLAIANYRRSLEFKPDNHNARRMLEQLERTAH